MNSRTIPPGFHQVRRDRELQEQAHHETCHYRPDDNLLRVHWTR